MICTRSLCKRGPKVFVCTGRSKKIAGLARTAGRRLYAAHQSSGRHSRRTLVPVFAVDGGRGILPYAQSELSMSAMKALALLSTLQSADIVLPTTDGREIRLRRITEPTAEQKSLLQQLGTN